MEEGPGLLLTRRTEAVNHHKGQIAFPGGSCDPADYAQNDRKAEIEAALRETQEEVGVSPNQVEILGMLPDVVTPSGFEITPVVGWASDANLVLHPNPSEIEEIFWVSLSTLR